MERLLHLLLLTDENSHLGKIRKLRTQTPRLGLARTRVPSSVLGDIHTADYVLNNTAAQEANFAIATGVQKKSVQWRPSIADMKTKVVYSMALI